MTRPRIPAPGEAPLRRRTLLRWGGAGLVLAGAQAVSGCGRADRVQVSGDAPRERRDAYRDLVEASLGPVQDLWGQRTVQLPVRLHLPAEPSGWAGATGQPVSSEVPASTVTRGGVSTVVVHPDAWDRLTGAGREAVVTHEVTHLAQGSSGSAPWWLGEGSAEFTAHRRSPVPPERTAGSQVWATLAGDPPTRWPEPTAGTTGWWQGYVAAWSVLLLVGQEHGDEAVPALHRAAARGDVDAACREVLGRTETDLRQAWTAWWAAQA